MERKAEKKKRGIPHIARRIRCLCMAIIMMIGVSGCMFRNGVKSSEETVAPQMLKYMEEKYGEKFRLSENNFMDANFAGTPTSLFLLPESHPDWYVTVNYEPGKPFSDNYVAYLKMDEVHDYLKPYFDEVYGSECRLFVSKPVSTPMPNDFDQNTDIKTYLSIVSIYIGVFVTTNPVNRDIDAQKVWDIAELADYSLAIGLFYFSIENFQQEEVVDGMKIFNSMVDLDTIPFICWGNLHIGKSLRDKGFPEINWREGKKTSTGIG